MSRIRNDIPLVPSVLDRLLDDDPSSERELPKSRSQSLRELIQSVRGDLENLLNTRWRGVGWPPELTELEHSLVNYGIPDITASDLGSAASREAFRYVLEAAIRNFEPRLKNFHVEFLDSDQPADRTLRFRIEGLLQVEPAPEPVVFDSSVELATGSVEVRGRNR
jgi:type VI secretion system protein ImpF